MTPTLEMVLAAVRAEQPRARELGVELVGVVGSIARGEERPDSDVDVIYAKVGRPTLFDLGEIMAHLEDALGRSIDMIDLNFVRSRRRSSMERDLVRV